jgi:hypothetical protein
MSFMGRIVFLAACVCAAQSPPPAPAPAAATTVKFESVSGLVKQQFGANFTIPAKFSKVLITADFDGDGVEDVAIVADSRDPLPDSFDYKYVVSDPYYSFFGFGNPVTTVGFGRTDPSHNHYLLVIFGAGPDAWRSATPKAKFVLINVPFDEIAVGRMLVKKGKPPIFVIKVVEAQTMDDSAVFFDAKKKKWKWQPV